MNDKVVIAGHVKLKNTIKAKTNLHNVINGTPSWVVNTGGGGIVYPHYTGSYTVTPSGSVQVLDTSDKVMDDDVTVQAVQAGSATTPATIITANPTLSRSGRVVTATVSKTQSVTPTVVEGYISAGTAGNIGVSGSDTLTIPEGSATTPATIITANPSISVSSGGLITATVSKTQQVTPTVQEGYVSAGTAGNVGVSGSNTEQLSVQGAQTIHPASTDQSIASGKYLTGAQTFKGVTVSGLTADKVLQGTTVEIGDSDDSDRIMKVVGTAQGGITPTGTKQISITQNGTTTEDVTSYASAEINVNVPASAVDTGTKSISSNGTHDVVGYANASVNVPNSYSASDEGKVVSNGALVAQTSDTVTANDTYDTTLINSLTVNVSGGGDGLYKLASGTVTDSDVDWTQITALREGAFDACTLLTTVGNPTLTNANNMLFQGCTGLTTAELTCSITNPRYWSNIFKGCTSLTQLVMHFTYTGNIYFQCNYLAQNCSALTTVIFEFPNSSNVTLNTTYAFYNTSSFRNLVIKCSSLVAMPNGANANAFGGIYNNPSLSTIYVPQALVSTYEQASNWSTLYGMGVTFAKIEGSIYE